MFKFFDMFRKSRITRRIAADETVFGRKYASFKSLLAGNNRALSILTDLENLLYENRPFSLDHVVSDSELLIGEVYGIVEDLNAMCGGKYPGLFDASERIGVAVLRDLVRRRRFSKGGSLILPLPRLSLENLDEVGGKAANLGEVHNRAGLPVPPGFAVTARACNLFLGHGGLPEVVERLMKGLKVEDTERLMDVSADIRSRIMRATLPTELETAILEEALDLEREFGPDLKFAVRSSATCEDSEASFAGQHSTALNVTSGSILQAYREVVASTFTPRAIFYRRSKGYSEDDVVMAVLCVAMVDAQASGVMYTADPSDARRDDVLVSSAWGLGVSVVEGGAADFYRVARAGGILEEVIARKESRLAMADGERLREEVVPEDLRQVACLEREQLTRLVGYGLRLEEHYGMPLDIEWAMDKAGRLFILQARPLNPLAGSEWGDKAVAPAAAPGAEVIVSGGQAASPGAASGLAYVLRSDHTLHSIPQGAILVAQQTSPAYVPIMGRVRAIVTDVGSVTGHMASVAREFGVPTLVGTGGATRHIQHGEEITVDAGGLVVYRGLVEQVLTERQPVNLMKGSPVYKVTQEALKKIAPLSLLDPRKDNFTPEGCRTLHDIIRFAHEMGMQEMFKIGDEFDEEENVAVRLRTYLPMSIYCVDLGGGLSVGPEARFADMADVTSVPFRALLTGMTHQSVRWLGPVGMSWGGFASIVAESVFRDPTHEGRMGGPSYAVVSGEYLNFSARLGYHFATVDTYCGQSINDNYIVFSFKGGAADIARRTRRAALISLILKRLGFRVEQKSDMVRGEIKKYDCDRLNDKLDHLGRLLGSVRLLDMVLSDDGQVSWYAEEFMRGNYSFSRDPGQASLP